MRSGRLFVKCPAEGCGRSLQTLELKDTLPEPDYELLVTRLQVRSWPWHRGLISEPFTS